MMVFALNYVIDPWRLNTGCQKHFLTLTNSQNEWKPFWLNKNHHVHWYKLVEVKENTPSPMGSVLQGPIQLKYTCDVWGPKGKSFPWNPDEGHHVKSIGLCWEIWRWTVANCFNNFKPEMDEQVVGLYSPDNQSLTIRGVLIGRQTSLHVPVSLPLP